MVLLMILSIISFRLFQNTTKSIQTDTVFVELCEERAKEFWSVIEHNRKYAPERETLGMRAKRRKELKESGQHNQRHVYKTIMPFARAQEIYAALDEVCMYIFNVY